MRILKKPYVVVEEVKFYYKNEDWILPTLLKNNLFGLSEESAQEVVEDLSNKTIEELKEFEGMSDEILMLLADIFNVCVVGWEGLLDDDGSEVEFADDVKLYSFNTMQKYAVTTAILNSMFDMNQKKE